MLLGIHLTLLIGPTVAVPAPLSLLEALQSVEVTHNDSGRSGFQLTFQAGRSGAAAALDYPILSLPLLRPFNRVILIATFNATPRVLMDGIITHQQLNPGSQAGAGSLTVTGEDVSIMMDLEEKNVEHPAQDETIIANKIIASYALYGLIPMVIPPLVIDPPIPIERTPVQRATDLEYLKQMAERHGYVFYVSPGPAPFTNTAYWGPPLRVGFPQKALSTNLGPETNLLSVNFQNDATAPTLVTGQVQDRQTGQTMPVRTFASLRPPLASQPAILVQQPNVRTERFQSSGLNTTQALGRAQGATDASTDQVVQVTGELDAVRYGEILQARGLVGLRGAGYTYDGFYYVKSVTHVLQRGGYQQRFTLTREGVGINHTGGEDITMPALFFGKYRGKAVNNLDPMQLGRIQVSVSAVLGEGRMSWAMPCTPYAGSGVGFFAIPPVDANVWVEFEGGDLDFPIWSGCFWGIGEVPASPAIPQMKVFKTDGITLTINDLPGAGGFTLEVQPPVVGLPLKMTFDASGVKVEATTATVTIAPAGIELTNNPSTVKVSPVNVSINNGALEVI